MFRRTPVDSLLPWRKTPSRDSVALGTFSAVPNRGTHWISIEGLRHSIFIRGEREQDLGSPGHLGQMLSR